MLFRIAEIVGSSVSELHSKITVGEFNGWVHYLNNKPADIMEVQMAVLSNIVASAAGAKNTKVTDFILSGKNDKPVKSKNLQKQNFNAFNAIAQDYKPSKK